MLESAEKEYADHPIITYSNRIQKHMFNLTEMLSQDNTISLVEKRKLRLIIANLPPIGKEELQEVQETLESNGPMDVLAFDKLYSKVSDWIYVHILQDAFRAIPLYRGKGKLEESTKRYGDNLGLGGR